MVFFKSPASNTSHFFPSRRIGDLKVTLMSSFTNLTVRVIAAAPMVLLWNFGIEALPYSYLAGWIAMLLVETPLMLRIYRKK